MLVLTRDEGQAIEFPGLGMMRVVEVKGKRVRLAFDFDARQAIYRQELVPVEQRTEERLRDT